MAASECSDPTPYWMFIATFPMVHSPVVKSSTAMFSITQNVVDQRSLSVNFWNVAFLISHYAHQCWACLWDFHQLCQDSLGRNIPWWFQETSHLCVCVCEGEQDSGRGALYLQRSSQVTEFLLRFIEGLSAGDHRAQSLLIWQTGG